jgi:5-methylcytosine-specific restriction endonuclease McrA
MTKNQLRRLRKQKRTKQKKTNFKLKKKLFGHLFVAPCCYCKSVFFVEDLTVEHVTPLCLGGTNDPTNIALACSPCNHGRGKEAWFKKQELNKRYYEQYYPKHRSQDGQSTIS